MKTLTNIVESVTPLYESILDRTKDKVGSVKKRINKLGMKFPLRSVFGITCDMGIFTKLEKSERYNELVDGLSMISNPKIECPKYWRKEVERFVTFIDNIDVEGCSTLEDVSCVITRELEEYLGRNVARCECFRSMLHIWMSGQRLCLTLFFEIMVDKRYFGGQFEFKTEKSLFRYSDMSIINTRTLERLTKGMEFKNPYTKALMEKGFLNYSDKLEMFIKWLENLDISEFGDVDLNNYAVLNKLCLYIRKRMFDDGLFNKPEIIKVEFKYSVNKKLLYIFIDKKTEYSRIALRFDKI